MQFCADHCRVAAAGGVTIDFRHEHANAGHHRLHPATGGNVVLPQVVHGIGVGAVGDVEGFVARRGGQRPLVNGRAQDGVQPQLDEGMVFHFCAPLTCRTLRSRQGVCKAAPRRDEARLGLDKNSPRMCVPMRSAGKRTKSVHAVRAATARRR